MNDRSYLLSEYIPRAAHFLFGSSADDRDRYEERMTISASIYMTLEFMERGGDLQVKMGNQFFTPIDRWHVLKEDNFYDGWEFFWRFMFNHVNVPMSSSAIASLGQYDHSGLDEWGLPE